MANGLRHLWNRHRIVMLMFAVALGLTGFFAVRMVAFGIYWSDPDNRDLAVEGWMPLRYVARSWNVPPEAIVDALTVSPDARATIADIARARDSDIATIRAEVTAAIAVWRAEQGDD